MIIEPIPHPTKLKCCNSKCKHVFKFYNVQYPIINDRGYAVFKCPECGGLTKIPVYNCDVISHVDDCVKCIELIDCKDNDCISSIRDGEWREDTADKEMPAFDLKISPTWKLQDRNIDGEAKELLDLNSNEIQNNLDYLKNGYLAGVAGADNINRVLIKINISPDEYFLWGKKISSENDIKVTRLNFIGLNTCHISRLINGIKDRNQCFSILNDMLVRWNLFAHEVFFVSPFIGFQYKNDNYDHEIREFWNWLGVVLDLNKTTFVTRKNSITMLKNAYEKEPHNFEYLKSWDDFNEIIKSAADYDGRKPEYKNGSIKLYQASHAKFYAGVFDDYVEVLSGSYNIHLGKTLENLNYNRYPKEEFAQLYLEPYSLSYRHHDKSSSRIFAALIEVNNEAKGNLNLLNEDLFVDIVSPVL